MTRVTLATANTPGAVAIILLHGPGVADVLSGLTSKNDWPHRRVRLCDFAGIDEGLAVLLHGEAAQLMPHGGPRVVQKLVEHLTRQLGCAYDSRPDTRALYPEADSPIEADVLDAIARASSPAAIDLLAAQPALWAARLKLDRLPPEQNQLILDRSRTLDRLINPPTVVVVGPPNAGKSTLTNALMGKAVSLVADLPGTTRDWVGGLVELSADQTNTNTSSHAVAVHWLDTPGLRASDDPIEQRAIALARQQVERADVLIAMRGVDQDWPDASALPRTPDLWIVNKADEQALTKPSQQAGTDPSSPILISALRVQGLGLLQARVIEALRLDRLDSKALWAFSLALISACESQDPETLRTYLQPSIRP